MSVTAIAGREEQKMGVKVDNVSVTLSENSLIPDRRPEYVQHGCFYDLRAIIEAGVFAPVIITGLTGNGKTLTPEQVCAIVKKEMIAISITEETDESDLIGHFNLVNGNMVWEDGPVIVAMERGALLLLDEIDQGLYKLMCLQNVLDGKPVYIKKINRVVRPAPGFMVVATANTKGRGAEDHKYVGNNVLNEAFLERFAFTFEQDYPSKPVEVTIVKKMFEKYGIEATQFTDELAEVLCEWSKGTRERYKEGAEDLISTRRLDHIVKGYSIFRDVKKALQLALNRFDEATAKAFMDYFDKLYDEEKMKSLLKKQMDLPDPTLRDKSEDNSSEETQEKSWGW